MQSTKDLVQTKLQPSEHCIFSELQPFIQQLKEWPHPRLAVDTDHVEVHPVGSLKIGRSEKMRHKLVGIHPIGLWYNYNSGRAFVIGLIAQVYYHRQFLSLHLSGNLLKNFGSGNLER